MTVDAMDILWALVTGAGCLLAAVVLLPAPPRRRRGHRHLLSPRPEAGTPTPGAMRDFTRPADPTGAGERRGFSRK